MAGILSRLEDLITEFQETGWTTTLEKRLTTRWVHNGQSVNVQGHPGQFTVVGLDEGGYLKATGVDGKVLSLEPDGNSFDMLKGLIHRKT